jgi:hypothetical protein
MMKKVAIIGSHGLFANYGGWDQLVNNLVLKKSEDIEYLIFNSADTKKIVECPNGVKVIHLKLKASGFEGLFYDFWSVILCFWKVDTILLLGTQGIPLIRFLLFFRKVRIVANVGGIEWERPKFNFLAKLYLKHCFALSFKLSKSVILDNPYYNKFSPSKSKANIIVIPYGGEIDESCEVNSTIRSKYPFIDQDYFLSVSRSLKDNQLNELCDSFLGSKESLVLISNFSKSSYGLEVLNRYLSITNIFLINGLYNKPELDLIRRKCRGYIHTHTLCGTAPSLVEMIIARRPIISIDRPQNRFTLNNEGFFFSSFLEIQALLKSNVDLDEYIPTEQVCKLYNWNKIVKDYENVF